MTRAEFRATVYGATFINAPDGIVDAALNSAHLKCSPESWGYLLNEGIALWTAHILAQTPEGKDLRLNDKNSAETSYLKMFNELQAVAGFGPVIV